jgi:hypothetical protein
MGYAWDKVCHQDTARALDQFKLDMASGDAVGLTNFTAQPTISGTGLITWSISHRPLTGTAATIRTGTTQLQTCTDGISQWSGSSIMFIAALFFAAMVGFRTGFRA